MKVYDHVNLIICYDITIGSFQTKLSISIFIPLFTNITQSIKCVSQLYITTELISSHNNSH